MFIRDSYYVDPKSREVVKSTNAFEHPQPHACFIQSVDDDLVNENGIMDLWVREARLFKYGSGTGTNFSRLRGDGEGLSGGGRSSGLMSFLKIGDRAAGAIKSCLLYTSDAADERSSVDLGGRRIIKNKQKKKTEVARLTYIINT